MQTNGNSISMHSTHIERSHGADWPSISKAYFHSHESLRSIAKRIGVSEAAVRKHARKHGWRRPSAVMMPTARGVSLLAAAMEAQLASADGIIERSRRFVAAMIQLDATPASIADALGVTEKALNLEFGDEFHFHTARRGR